MLLGLLSWEQKVPLQQGGSYEKEGI